MQNTSSKILQWLFFLLVTLGLYPNFQVFAEQSLLCKRPSKEKPGTAMPHYLTLLINGLMQEVEAGEKIFFIKGDLLQVQALGVVQGVQKKAALRIKFVGQEGVPLTTEPTDLNYELKTDTIDAKLAFYDEEHSKRYKIFVYLNKDCIDEYVLYELEPKLHYLEISLNGKKRVLRDGESFRLNVTDKMQMDRISSNINNISSINFRTVQASSVNGENTPIKKYAIQLEYKNSIFAQIPLELE